MQPAEFAEAYMRFSSFLYENRIWYGGAGALLLLIVGLWATRRP